MNLTVEIFWPIAFTVSAFAGLAWAWREIETGDSGGLLNLLGAFVLLLASGWLMIGSIISWFIWAVLT